MSNSEYSEMIQQTLRLIRGEAAFYLRVSAIIATLIILLYVIIPPTAFASHGGNCISVDWEVGGSTGNGVQFYGVTGYNTVWAPQATGNYINSIDVYLNANNHVEWGWHQQGSTRDYNVVYRDQGQYHHHHVGTPSGGNHNFILINYSDYNWRWIVGGQQKDSHTLSFDRGTPLAFRERHNSCDSIWAHWWNLNRCDSTGSCQLWNNHQNRDFDPHSYPNFPSNYEFYANSN